MKIIFPDDVKSIPARGGIGSRGTGSDRIEPVSQNVRKNDLIDLGRSAVLRKASALDFGKMLADGIDLFYIGTAFKQLIVDADKFFKRDERIFE